ncbi:hypothetical protein FACS1894105_13690 [Clostridia bacterium]|nr:hypothetical protein FACS1894105_13690 [Clostridia bacterium]
MPSFTHYKCPKCGRNMRLSGCDCGFLPPHNNGIYQLTTDPYISIGEQSQIKYIGYEEIGEFYSGESIQKNILIDDKYRLIKEFVGDGILLDLACGDGIFTVPLASLGMNIIAMDISDKMLSLLLKRAEYQKINLSNVIVCRGNALDLPFAGASLDAVFANSVLHLISDPAKVINEIHRVLKPNGIFITCDDKPGETKIGGKKLTASESDSNRLFNELANFIYREYWSRTNALNIHQRKYNWTFDRDAICDDLFPRKESHLVRNSVKLSNVFASTFLHRFSGKGFSDMIDVPAEIHKSIFEEVMCEFNKMYDSSALQTVYTDFENDEEITVYSK